jgi:hypothetical protein
MEDIVSASRDVAAIISGTCFMPNRLSTKREEEMSDEAMYGDY